jgi:hypothetical protein
MLWYNVHQRFFLWWNFIINYIEKVIYCGTENNVLLLVYSSTIIHIQNQNKAVEFLVAWLFTMPYIWKMFLWVVINHYWRELWPITIERDYWSWCSLWCCIFNTHFLQIKSFQHILQNIFGFTYVFIQIQDIRIALIFMSLNLWNQQLARISLPWWSTPCTIHNFTLRKPQIMWYLSKSQSTSIHVYQINVESQNNVLHINRSKSLRFFECCPIIVHKKNTKAQHIPFKMKTCMLPIYYINNELHNL